MTALIRACYGGHTNTCRALVKAGAMVEAKDNDGNTPLIWASAQGHLTTVKFLVEECHANVEAKANAGITALWTANNMGKSDVVAYLRSKGATE